ncbi:post-transcriptional regulator [Cohnella terricola]|uniref:post-transcriptional regulator n=1 Tax=Cohnella terricola TaxID=1289167 RepID=UPI00319DE5DA
MNIERIKSIIKNGAFYAFTTDREGTAVEELEKKLPNDEMVASDSGSSLSEFELNETIAQLCQSKAEEFRLIGYEQVTGPDVWECVSDKYHKKGTPPLYEVVNDILSLKVTQFMNFITLSMYRGEIR